MTTAPNIITARSKLAGANAFDTAAKAMAAAMDANLNLDPAAIAQAAIAAANGLTAGTAAKEALAILEGVAAAAPAPQAPAFDSYTPEREPSAAERAAFRKMMGIQEGKKTPSTYGQY